MKHWSGYNIMYTRSKTKPVAKVPVALKGRGTTDFYDTADSDVTEITLIDKRGWKVSKHNYRITKRYAFFKDTKYRVFEYCGTEETIPNP